MKEVSFVVAPQDEESYFILRISNFILCYWWSEEQWSGRNVLLAGSDVRGSSS